MLEHVVQRQIDRSKNMLVPFYLLASYAYYVKDDPIVSDAFYDKMAHDLLENWNAIEHYHKEHISLQDLMAGSFLGKYPSIIGDSLEVLRKQYGE